MVTTSLEQSRATVEWAKFNPIEQPEWERRFLEKVRLLRQSGNGVRLYVEFQDGHMTLWVMSPAGKVKLD